MFQCCGNVTGRPSVVGYSIARHRLLTCTLRIDSLSVASMRDIETIDSQLGLLLAIRQMVREIEGRPPSTARIDALLDERAAAPGQDLVAAQPVQCHHKAAEIT